MNSFSTEAKAIRKFGAIGLIFFGALLSLSLWRQKLVLSVLLGVFACLGLGFLLLPVPLRPLYEGWMKVSHFMGKVSTLLILTVAYYLVITPTAWIKRVFGGQPLPTSPDTSAVSYWVERPEPAQPKERFEKRY